MEVTSFKHIFRSLRKEKSLTQEMIAERLGISKSTIAMWETGQRFPSPELYEQIADFFNVDIDYLYGRTPIRQRVHYDPDGNKMQYVPEKDAELLKWYSNPETAAIVQQIYQDKDRAFLFELLPDLTPEQIKLLSSMAQSWQSKNDE